MLKTSKNISCLFLFVLFYFLPLKIAGQGTSFQIALDSTNFRLYDAVLNKGDSVALVLIDPLPDPDSPRNNYILPIENNIGMNEGFRIRYPQYSSTTASSPAPVSLVNAIYNNNRVVVHYQANFGTLYSKVITSMDLGTGGHWSKLYPYGDSGQLLVNGSGELIVVGSAHAVNTDSVLIEFVKFDPNGFLEDQEQFKVGLGIEDLHSAHISQAVLDEEENIYFAGAITISGNLSEPVFIVAKFDRLFNPLLLKTVEGYEFNEIVMTENGPMMLNYAIARPEFFNLSITDNALIAQLDHDLNFVWGKEYYGENFPYHTASINKRPDGTLIMAHVTEGAFPVVLTELDSTGIILSQKGYPNYEPQIDILSDNSILMSSPQNFDQTGNVFRQPILAKTDTEGNIDGCTTYPTCIGSKDFTLQFGTFELEPYGTPSEFWDYTVEVTPMDFSFSEGCDFPPAPVPDFRFPDTLCQNDIATTTETKNRLANAHEWHLAGPGVDSVNTDSFDFSFRFSAAGEYVLRHTVWVLGCSYAFEKSIAVLPELEINITPEHLCPDGPFEIGVFSEREIKNYLWGNGSSEEKINIAAPGIYSVEVSDGYCTAYDTSEVKFVSELIGDNNVINLPADTTLCEINLPFTLKIESDFTDVFFINGDSVSNNEFSINKSGEYLIEAEIFNCPFSAVFSLTTSNCRAEIYLPNVFSPNGDGINDSFFPVGNGFEMSSLKIFDRWGGLRYDGQGTGAKWSPGLEVGQGSYLYQLSYLNVLTGLQEQQSGDIILIR